jgi:RNA polymerase sigma-70 factor (ECF subfamily)
MVLCEWEERSVAEAAAILETTPKSVESRLYRARQILRERLKHWLH